MDTAPDTGGPAFPHAMPGALCEGMTLLDWFAGQALMGLMMADDNTMSAMSAKQNADCAYYNAQSMLAEKRKREAAP